MQIAVKWVRPLMVALIAFIVTFFLITTIGELLLSAVDETVTQELRRRELWIGVALTVGILAGASFLASRPQGKLGPLDREVAIGKTPMSAYDGEMPPVDLAARHGTPGTIADIAPGYTLYARSGALASVDGVIETSEQIGGTPRKLIYAHGLYGAQNEMWIPIEAVLDVFPETESAFLAIRGDEVEAFSWDRPPQSFSRTPRKPEVPLY